jgi:hypothetical protein
MDTGIPMQIPGIPDTGKTEEGLNKDEPIGSPPTQKHGIHEIRQSKPVLSSESAYRLDRPGPAIV